MKNIILLEIKNCMQRKEFKIVFMILFFLSIGSYVIDCYEFFGQELSYVRSAYESCIIQSVQSYFVLTTELLLLPLIATMVYSDSYYLDCKRGVYKSIITRIDKRRYIIAKAIAIFTTVFAVFFIPLAVNQFLCLIAFPTEGFDNNQSLPPYDIGFQNYHQENRFDFLRIQAPFLYNLLHMAIIGLFASLFALLAYALYFIYKKSRLSVIGGIFITYLLQEVVLSFIGEDQNRIESLLAAGGTGSVAIMLLWIAALFISSVALIIHKGFKDEPEIQA